jgi:thiopeptide-type bacteriocin biosynthesis protein
MSDDQLIAGPLRSFGEFATSAGLSDGWFFVRYTDPDPHLRIRFHGEPAALLGPLLRQLCDWAGELVTEGACTRFAFDTYEREVERYGGEDGMRAAETVFTADSPAVAEILLLCQVAEPERSYDMMTLAVLSIDDLLDSIGLDAGERVQVYLDAASRSRHGGVEYRTRQRELRRLLSRPGAVAQSPEGTKLARPLATRRAALDPTAAILDSLEGGGLLHRPRAQICRSYIHMHANRLLGRNPLHEQLALELLRRTYEGLIRAPLA